MLITGGSNQARGPGLDHPADQPADPPTHPLDDDDDDDDPPIGECLLHVVRLLPQVLACVRQCAADCQLHCCSCLCRESHHHHCVAKSIILIT